ncbi:MAG: hypothetical protein CFE24_03960 [Flavobacterium sp. BFFFF2]|nr:MAG: hypothetical protein CFE24_03960 [Flavobacterium sp. BFFFF2]
MKTPALISIFLIQMVFGQKPQVVDRATHKAIEYATLVFYQKGKIIGGQYTDAAGYFTAPSQFDQLVVSCMGYVTQTLVDKDRLFISLEPSTFQLDEVIVKPNRTFEAGTIYQKKFKWVGLNNGLELGVYIKNESGRRGKIQKVQFKVGKVSEDITYRIHFYTYTTKPLTPGTELTHSNALRILSKGTTGLVEADVEDENVIFPLEGVYATVECISGTPISDYSGYLVGKKAMFCLESHRSSLFDFLSINKLNGVGWVNVNEWWPINYEMTFNKELDRKQQFVPTFGLLVKEVD